MESANGSCTDVICNGFPYVQLKSGVTCSLNNEAATSESFAPRAVPTTAAVVFDVAVSHFHVEEASTPFAPGLQTTPRVLAQSVRPGCSNHVMCVCSAAAHRSSICRHLSQATKSIARQAADTHRHLHFACTAPIFHPTQRVCASGCDMCDAEVRCGKRVAWPYDP